MPAKEEAAEYCYFLNDTVRELFFEGGDTVGSYKILSWTHPSDRLWAVRVEFRFSKPDTTVQGYNFVGRIDGKYYVMQSTDLLPEDLKAGLDPQAYEPTGGNFIGLDDSIMDNM